MRITFEDNFPKAFQFPPPPLHIKRKKEMRSYVIALLWWNGKIHIDIRNRKHLYDSNSLPSAFCFSKGTEHSI